MNAETSVADRPEGGESIAWRRLDRVCRGVALVGIAALVAMMGVVVGSVLSAQFGAPILGDTEIIDQLTGILVFCFLPYCHLHGGNVIVDFFTRPLPKRATYWLDAVMNLVFALVASVVTWRLIAGGISAFTRDQRSMFLHLPEWTVYALGSTASVLWVVVILFVAWEHALRASGRLMGPAAQTSSFG